MITNFVNTDEYGSTMIHRSKLVLSTVVLAVSVLPACGGDSGPSSSDKAFCKEIEQLDQLDVEKDISQAADILSELAKKAPNKDVRDALGVIGPIFEQLSTVDQNDEAAMTAIFELMSSPEVAAASDVLDQYGTDVCGFDDTSNSTPADSAP